MEGVGTPLEHVMVVGGTPKDWDAIGVDEWGLVVDRLRRGGRGGGRPLADVSPLRPAPGGQRQ